VASIEKRVRNGRTTYCVRYRDPAKGERRKVFDRKRDADDFALSLENAKRTGAYVDPQAGKVTFGEWAERWFKTTATLKPTTRRDYRSLLDNHVLPRFGDWPLAGIDTLAVKEWRAAMVEGGLGGKRAGKAMQVLSLVLSSAVEGGRLATNKAAGVKLPKVQRREMLFLDAGQVEALAYAMDPRWRVLVLLSAYTGLRPCEVVALRVARLDLLRGTVRVAEAAPEVAGRLEWGSVKTHEARTVHLPRFLRDELAAHLAASGAGPDALVFTAARGGPIRESKWVPGYFKPAVRAAGLPEALRWYDLRHTAASLLIREGASIKAVQKQMGHATAAITLDVYGHLFPDELPELAERLERLHERAAAERWPQRGPEVVSLRNSAGQ
jgi:integrase